MKMEKCPACGSKNTMYKAHRGHHICYMCDKTWNPMKHRLTAEELWKGIEHVTNEARAGLG